MHLNPDQVSFSPDPVNLNMDPANLNRDPVNLNPDPVDLNPDPVNLNPTPVSFNPDPSLQQCDMRVSMIDIFWRIYHGKLADSGGIDPDPTFKKKISGSDRQEKTRIRNPAYYPPIIHSITTPDDVINYASETRTGLAIREL